ncbi:hypothetical protein CCH79_00018170 [Gambusia affinis]|uniref:Transcription initiation factor TFIID subunit 2 n=1 Tax=Gambusia affinis TaxID=33528 RepID=A0A315VJL6_GAMAF|nr:hypothetical protein CCH79_00018170 [Gambusia affinis]
MNNLVPSSFIQRVLSVSQPGLGPNHHGKQLRKLPKGTEKQMNRAKCEDQRKTPFRPTKNANEVSHWFDHSASIDTRMAFNLNTQHSKNQIQRETFQKEFYNLCKEVAVPSSAIGQGRPSAQPTTVRNDDVVHIGEEGVSLRQDHCIQAVRTCLLHTLNEKLHIYWQVLVDTRSRVFFLHVPMGALKKNSLMARQAYNTLEETLVIFVFTRQVKGYEQNGGTPKRFSYSFGYVELTIFPTVVNLNRIKLNSKQCRIYRVRVNDLEAPFIYNDPTLEVCHNESKQRNLNYFSSAYTAAVSAVDPDAGNGELVIKVPSELWKQGDELKVLKVYIEFSLDQPKGGLHFVVPDVEGSMAERGAHVFSFGYQNSTRFWFPCVDSYSELCTWKLEFTVDASMVAVSCGDLVETIYTHDMRKKTFHYVLPIPTAAPNISLAVGPFEILVDPYMHEVTHFCLPQLLPLLKHSMSYLHEIFEFYEEILTCRYPYSCFKTVFVDEAYVQVSSYASMSIFSTNLLHSPMIIDQTPQTRRCLAQALAQQFFGCFISRMSWADEWVLKGISGYIYGLYLKKTFGVNEYRHWIKEELDRIVEYELKMGGVLLHPTFSGGKEKDNPTPHLHFSIKHPHTLSWEYFKMFQCKAHLVMRLIENRISMEFMLQVFNKLLSLASTASSQKYQSHMWSQMLLSTHAFLKSISNVSGKDIGPLIKHDQSGVVKFFGSFAFNRKRNVLELEIRQDYTSSGTQKYVGPIKVTVQELDGSFNHTLQIEENSLKHDIPCHSKSRRNKKKKIPLMNGEEVDMDLSAMDADSPLLWIRIDPDMSILRKVEFEQADFMWQYQLRYERDVVAQEEAITALEKFPTPASRLALTDILEQEQCFYKVRMQACFCLAKRHQLDMLFSYGVAHSQAFLAREWVPDKQQIANSMVSTWQGPPAMKSLFTRMFCCKSCPNIVRTNNFINFQSYFLQKTMPVAMALLRDVQNLCPKDVLNFILDLIKYNDNRKNKFSDNYYRADLIEALTNSLTPAISINNEVRTVDNLNPDVRLILEEITRFLNMEKLLPSFRNTITVSCLRAIRQLQKNGHIPSDPSLFKAYAEYGHFVDVRVSALEALVDYTRVERSSADLQWLLDMVQSDPVHYVRHEILGMLCKNPPFTKSADSGLCNEALVDQLWKLMNSDLWCIEAECCFSMFGFGSEDAEQNQNQKT